MCGLVVKWLSRLPVTEEIAGSNPVELAIAIMVKRPERVFFGYGCPIPLKYVLIESSF